VKWARDRGLCFVIAGLDTAIHAAAPRIRRVSMNHRVKPGGDDPVSVMAGHSRSKNGVASLAYVPAIHVFLFA
jgi:hypothetical protein